MDAVQWLAYISLALLLGATGQVLRVVVGLKKLHDKSAATVEKVEPLNAGKLIVSILLGAGSGAVAAIAMWKPEVVSHGLERDFVGALIASGYAGSDFIEGFMERALKKVKTG